MISPDMNFVTHSHRHGLAIISEPEFFAEWNELQTAITSITDEDIIRTHQEKTPKRKSISHALNLLLQRNLVGMGWEKESAIFNDDEYKATEMELDFAKQAPDGGISVEVAFNRCGCRMEHSNQFFRLN